nr:MAG TPA: FlhB HrpN YscU SpaS Family [Caudoviricetes sp.]
MFTNPLHYAVAYSGICVDMNAVQRRPSFSH